jgi:hypothetical protein
MVILYVTARRVDERESDSDTDAGRRESLRADKRESDSDTHAGRRADKRESEKHDRDNGRRA